MPEIRPSVGKVYTHISNGRTVVPFYVQNGEVHFSPDNNYPGFAKGHEFSLTWAQFLNSYERNDLTGESNPPVNTVLPAISGTATQGETLTGTSGTWTNSPTFTYQWRADGVAITGATNTTYVLTVDEVGKVISLRVTATNADGAPTADSPNTAPVQSSSGLTLSWTSGTTAYDPIFNFTGLVEGDSIELQIDDNIDFLSLYGSDTNVIDAFEIENGQITFPAIPTLGFGTTYYARARKGVGAWSNVVSKAMAVQTPTLTLPTTGALGATTATVGITTNVDNGNLRLVMSTTNVRPSDTQFDAGQDSTGAAAAFTNNVAIASTGAKTANATGLSANTAYYPFWRHTSATGGKGYFDGTTFTTNSASLYNNVGVYGSPGAFGQSGKSITGIVVPTGGLAIIFTHAYIGATPTTLTFGGVSCTLHDTQGELQVWSCAITAGTHTLTLSNGAGNLYAFTASVGTVVGGSFVATTKDNSFINGTGGTPSIAKPASGGIIAALGFQETTVPASPTLSVVSPSTEIAQGSHELFNGESRGLVSAERPSTGEVIFNINGQLQAWPRIALSYQV